MGLKSFRKFFERLSAQVIPGGALSARIKELSSCPWKNAEVPAEALAVPTMLSIRERQLLHWLTRHYYTGAGRIVDGGSFLGGSTAALASGLAARTDGRWENAIASYDLFLVEEYTLTYFGQHFPNSTIGASFRPVYDKHIAPWKRHVSVREGDAFKIGWSGEPIEVLFLDMVKLWQLNDLVLDQFFPCLIPGRTVIIQQDYLWGFGPWTHITMELMAPSVKVLDSMPNGSVAYLLTKPVPKEVIGLKVREALSPQRQRQLMDAAVERWQGEERGLVELARVMLIAERDLDEARHEYAQTCKRYAKVERVEQCAKYMKQYLAEEKCPWLADVDPKIWAA